MIVVDSGTWGDYFNGTASAVADRLEEALRNEEDVTILPIILTEVLQGFRSDTGFQKARRLLTSLPIIQPGIACHVRAAGLHRTLRRRGLTVRGAVDCFIAQACIDSRALLLSPDRDFKRMAVHTPLKVWSA